MLSFVLSLKDRKSAQTPVVLPEIDSALSARVNTRGQGACVSRLPPIDFPELPILIADHEDQALLQATHSYFSLHTSSHASHFGYLYQEMFPRLTKARRDTTDFTDFTMNAATHLIETQVTQENCTFGDSNSAKLSQGYSLKLCQSFVKALLILCLLCLLCFLLCFLLCLLCFVALPLDVLRWSVSCILLRLCWIPGSSARIGGAARKSDPGVANRSEGAQGEIGRVG